MFVYAGIDEAGYGPMFGPMVIGRSLLTFPTGRAERPPDVWATLDAAICQTVKDKRNRLPVNDSKKLYTPASGLKHLERSVLAFASVAGFGGTRVNDWLDFIGETSHHQLNHLPWYAADDAAPWQELPGHCTAGEVAVGRGMLSSAIGPTGVDIKEMRASVVFEDRFNQMVKATRSKASASFTFVAGHLHHVWQEYGEHHPLVAVDRQSGRTHYLELLQLTIPEAQVRIVEESAERACYELVADKPKRAMAVTFETEAEKRHLPVALASMISKYTREVMMARFQAWFTSKLPGIKPTAGYGADAKRFWQQVQPHLKSLSIERAPIYRQA